MRTSFDGKGILALALAMALAACTPIRRNVLVIIADDLGRERPSTWFQQKLRLCGISFENAWASPTCSPTRASILTGQYPFRLGITEQLAPTDAGLDPAFITLPEALDDSVRSALIGKWHLGVGPDLDGDGAPDSPLDQATNTHGFDYYAGSLYGSLDSYQSWDKVTSERGGTTTSFTSTTQATWDAGDEAFGWISAQIEDDSPWVAFVAFNAPHGTPIPKTSPVAWQWLEEDLLSAFPANSPAYGDVYDAQLESLDNQMGNLILRLAYSYPDALERTTIIFIGDNGTPSEVAASPITNATAKGTLYQGGVCVPFIVADGYRWIHGKAPGDEKLGNGAMRTEPGTNDALVHVADIYSTILAMTMSFGGDGEDSVSLIPYLGGYEPIAPRETIYTEGTVGNSPTYAVWDGRYKMIVTDQGGGADLIDSRDWDDANVGVQLFDLSLDPWEEAADAHSPVGALWLAEYNVLRDAMEAVWDS